MVRISGFLYFILNAIFSLVLANFGILVIRDFPEKPYLGVSIIVLAFLLIFFTDSIFRVRDNTKQIKEISEEIDEIKSKAEFNEKLLNTLKDIILLRRSKNE